MTGLRHSYRHWFGSGNTATITFALPPSDFTLQWRSRPSLQDAVEFQLWAGTIAADLNTLCGDGRVHRLILPDLVPPTPPRQRKKESA
jgi:hypothetical protein